MPFLILKITRKHTKFPHFGTDFPIKNRLFYGIRSHFEDTYGNFRHNLSSGAKLTVYKEKKIRRRRAVRTATVVKPRCFYGNFRCVMV